MLLRVLRPGNRKYVGGFLLITAISVICVAFSLGGDDDFALARREVLLRKVGHELLLQSGDSTSRVLPVEKLAGNEYRLDFEKAFAFRPDSLVQTTRRLLAADPLGSNYVVNVLNGTDAGPAYGYAVSANKKEDIIACLGRTYPKAPYLLSVRFQPAQTGTAKKSYLLGSLALVVILGFLAWQGAKPRRGSPGKDRPLPAGQADLQPPATGVFTLGAMAFNAEARKLVVNGQAIDLTKTETRVLRIFAAAPNEIIERSRLQKEIWEDEGVIVGRSLDMFISKLRKKLEADPTVRLAVVRGRGYRLQISPQDAAAS